MSRKIKLQYYVLLTVGLFCLIGFFNIQGAYGQSASISRSEAYTWAKNWYNNNSNNLKSTTGPEKLIMEGGIGNKNLYLASFSPLGFVVFSNEANPLLLAYSLDNPLPEDKNHPLYSVWLPHYSKQLAEAEAQKGLNTGFIESYDLPAMDERIDPLIEAMWGQGIPWNKYCPADESDRHAPVGCVAVALAQIMNKWEWPIKGKGQNSYIPASHREYGTVEAVFDTTYYQWDQMHNSDPSDASALLLFHAGVATNMNYGPNESGANTSVYASSAMVNHFLYNPELVLREKGNFTYDQWAQLLRQDLVNGRPVLYRGTNPVNGVGHAFNIDGYRDKYFFHFNWGWYGSGNGYYRLEAMSAGGGDFTKGQAAFFGIQPNNQPQHDRPIEVEVMAGDGFIQLFWDELWVSNLSHYNIYRNGELIGSTWETRFRDEEVINGVNYSYHLSADYLGDNPGESVSTPNIEITPWKAISMPYSQNFNDSLAGWQIGGTNTSFQWKRADSMGFMGNNSKIIGIRSDLAGPGNKVSDHFISPMLDIRGLENVAIKFDYLLQQVPKVDFLFLMYRRFDNGLWYPISRLDSTESWSDWQTFYTYIPSEAKNTLIQLGFFYTDYNGVGKGAAIDNLELFIVQNPPVPKFVLSHKENCQNQAVTITQQVTGQVTSWFWDFGEGADPRYGYDQGPYEVSYSSGGSKSISLVLNHLDHLTKDNILNISWNTKADFNYSREGLLVSFENLSEYPQTVLWNFGDGKTSTELNPVYRYKSKLEFDVELVTYSPPCKSDTMRMHLDLRNGTGIEELIFEESIKIYPNPADDYLNISWANYDEKPVSIDLTSPTGSIVRCWKANFSESFFVDLNGISRGIYWLKIARGERVTFRKLIIYN